MTRYPPCTLFCPVEDRAAAAGLLSVRPEIADRVFDSFSRELLDFAAEAYPRVSDEIRREGAHPDSRRHYRNAIVSLLPPDEVKPSPPRPDSEAVLVAICCVGFMLAKLMPPPPKTEKVKVRRGDMDMEAYLDLLTFHSGNAFGPPYGVTDTLVEIWDGVLRSTPGLPEDRRQETVFNAFFQIGGPTPGLVERVVETGQIPYEAKNVFPAEVTVETIKSVYADSKACFEAGLDIRALARALRQEAQGADLIDGLTGQWIDIYVFLIPYIWPPSVATASLLPIPPPVRHEEWIRANLDFLRRVGWRDAKRVKRGHRRQFPRSDLDYFPFQKRKHVRKRGSPVEAAVLQKLWRAQLLQSINATQREKQVALLHYLWGWRSKDIAQCLGLTPARVSQLLKQFNGKCDKQLRTGPSRS